MKDFLTVTEIKSHKGETSEEEVQHLTRQCEVDTNLPE